MFRVLKKKKKISFGKIRKAKKINKNCLGLEKSEAKQIKQICKKRWKGKENIVNN